MNNVTNIVPDSIDYPSKFECCHLKDMYEMPALKDAEWDSTEGETPEAAANKFARSMWLNLEETERPLILRVLVCDTKDVEMGVDMYSTFTFRFPLSWSKTD